MTFTSTPPYSRSFALASEQSIQDEINKEQDFSKIIYNKVEKIFGNSLQTTITMEERELFDTLWGINTREPQRNYCK